MNKILKTITLIFFLVFSVNIASSKENFFDEVYISTSKFPYTRANAILKEINNSSNYNWLCIFYCYSNSFFK